MPSAQCPVRGIKEASNALIEMFWWAPRARTIERRVAMLLRRVACAPTDGVWSSVLLQAHSSDAGKRTHLILIEYPSSSANKEEETGDYYVDMLNITGCSISSRLSNKADLFLTAAMQLVRENFGSETISR